jgi:hypothetical protein
MMAEILVADSAEAILIRIQSRPAVVRACKIAVVCLALAGGLAPLILGETGLAVSLCAAVAIIPTTIPIFLSRYFTEWLVDDSGVTEVTQNGIRFVPMVDIVDFQYNPWVPPATDDDVGHGGCIDAQLRGRSLSGDNLQFGRGLSQLEVAPLLTRLRSRLPEQEPTP